MNRHDNAASPRCPVGEESCTHIDELTRLKTEVQSLTQALRTDTLTGLYNFRHFTEALENEMERTQRSRNPTTLLVLDIDFFKKVNDNWGHEAGNLALQHVAQLLKQHTRRLDVACRYGGEEFTVILPSTPLQPAMEVAERLRLAIEKAPVPQKEGPLALTASIGVECYRTGMEMEADEFFQRADGYLYQAKQGGRNRVCGPPPEESSEVSSDEKEALLR